MSRWSSRIFLSMVLTKSSMTSNGRTAWWTTIKPTICVHRRFGQCWTKRLVKKGDSQFLRWGWPSAIIEDLVNAENKKICEERRFTIIAISDHRWFSQQCREWKTWWRPAIHNFCDQVDYQWPKKIWSMPWRFLRTRDLQFQLKINKLWMKGFKTGYPDRWQMSMT